MKNYYYILLLSMLIYIQVSASTMYTLSEIKVVYPVVEILTNDVPKKYKSYIQNEIKDTLDELNISYTGYNQRAFAILVTSIKVKETLVIQLELLIGEEVKRKNLKQKVFAATYIDKDYFLYSKGDDLEDMIDDSLVNLLDKFSQQYIEDNKVIKRVQIKSQDFSTQMNYETSFEKARIKAKKAKKDILLILVSNYCPWCRKFEKNVLQRKDINTQIHKKYIPLIINKEKQTLPKEYQTSFSPVMYFINYKTFKTSKKVVGYNNKDEFLYLISQK